MKLEDLNKIIEDGFATTYTNCLGKITALSSDFNFASVEILGINKRETGNYKKDIILENIPVCAFGNKIVNMGFKPNVGDVVFLVFTKYDISLYLENEDYNNVSSELQFNRDSCFAIPLFVPTNNTKIAYRDAITTNGANNINGNINHTGDTTTSGTITGSTNVIGGGISLNSHTHGGVQTGGGSTGGPA